MTQTTYFYDYYAKEYREGNREKLLPAPAAMLQDIGSDEVRRCRTVLRNAFSGYREGRNRELLKRLLNEYRDYVSGSGAECTKDRYNAFVYRYMIDVPVGYKAIGNRLGVTKDTAAIYVRRVIDELLLLCMGIPAAVDIPEDRAAFVRMLIDWNRFFQNMSGEYVLLLFQGQRERKTIEQGRELTAVTMKWLTETIEAYSGYCNDTDIPIDTDIRKAEILGKCMSGVSACCLAEEYGCNETTIYSDIRENENRLAAMMFETDGGVFHA
jgi:hypothetical protein